MASGSQNMTTDKARQAFYLEAPDQYGYYTDKYGNLIYKYVPDPDNPTTGYFHLDNNAKTISLRYYWDSGDIWVPGKVGIGYNPTTSDNTYKLYVNGTSYFTNTAYFGDGTTYYISADGSQYSGNAATATNSGKLGGIIPRGFLRVYLNYNDISSFDTVGADNYLYSHSDTGDITGGTKPAGSHNGFAVLNTHSHSGNYCQQMGFDVANDCIWYRTANNTTSFTAWRKLLSSINYTDYTVTKTGSGASGTWGISITGNAGTATTLQTPRTIWGQSFNGSANISGNLTGVGGSIYGASGITTINFLTSGGGALNGKFGAIGISSDYSNTDLGTYGFDIYNKCARFRTANAALEIATSSPYKIGTDRKTVHIQCGNASGAGVNDGYASAITFGDGSAYAGIYYQSSGSYGSRLIFGTTDSYANGAYGRMIINHVGRVGIGTMSPDTALTISAAATDSIGAIHVQDTRTDGGWHYPFLGTCANLPAGANMYICIGRSASTGYAAGLRYNYQGASSNSNLMGFEFYGQGTKLWCYANGNGGVSGTWDCGNITIAHATSNDMAHSSANPKITFSESGSQPVHLIYTDYDSYRAPAGLKVVGGASASPAWFEVEGDCYAARFNGPLTGNVTGNCSGSSGSCTGNAATVSRATFGNATNGEHNANNITSNGLYYYTTNGPSDQLGARSTDGSIYCQAYDTNWVSQIAQDFRDGGLYVRGKKSGTWQKWLQVPLVDLNSSAITNCNSVYRTGIYTNGGFSNRPSGVSNWGTLVNYKLYESNNNYHRQMFYDCYSTDRILTRSCDGGSWTSWKELVISGTAHNLSEGTSDWTDNTEILTSYASNNGFSDSNGKGIVYRRDAIKAYNYIKGKASGTWGISITGNAATATRASTVGDGSTNAAVSQLGLISKVSWNPSVTSARPAVHHIVMFNQSLASVWVCGTNDIYVVIREGTGWVQHSSSSGSVNVSTWGATFYRTDGSSSNRLSVKTNNGSNASITIISF